MLEQIREAVKNATAYFVGVTEGPIGGVMLEEVTKSLDGKHWLITLSAWVPDTKPKSQAMNAFAEVADIFKPDQIKIYRTFEVNTSSGEVDAMKMRPMP